MKKLIAIFVVSVLLITNLVPSFATSAVHESKIIEALQKVEYIKDDMGLSDINFEEISISNPVYTYEYIDNTFIQSRIMYPLKINNKLIAWAITMENDDTSEFQITTALVKEVNLILTTEMEITFIYDYEHCYLFNGNEFYLIRKNALKVEGRSILETDKAEAITADLHLANINSSIALNYSAATTPRAPIYYSCSVGFVSQNPPSNLCWAASVACIVNYRKDKNYTATQVAQKHFGETNFNNGVSPSDIPSILLTDYLMFFFSYKNEVPSGSAILHNIVEDFPIYASFKHSNGYHAVVIYGINVSGGYLSIMDPEFGFCTASPTTSGYRYVSGYSGVTLTFARAVCRYWSA